jgi:hypothetical protein
VHHGNLHQPRDVPVAPHALARPLLFDFQTALSQRFAARIWCGAGYAVLPLLPSDKPRGRSAEKAQPNQYALARRVARRESRRARLSALHRGFFSAPDRASRPHLRGPRQRAPRGALLVAPGRSSGAARVQVCETCPQGPHPAPPSERLATTPSVEQDATRLRAPRKAGISSHGNVRRGAGTCLPDRDRPGRTDRYSAASVRDARHEASLAFAIALFIATCGRNTRKRPALFRVARRCDQSPTGGAQRIFAIICRRPKCCRRITSAMRNCKLSQSTEGAHHPARHSRSIIAKFHRNNSAAKFHREQSKCECIGNGATSPGVPWRSV